MTWTFDDFKADTAIGTAEQVVDDAQVSDWLAIYDDQPDTRPLIPAGTAMLILGVYLLSVLLAGLANRRRAA